MACYLPKHSFFVPSTCKLKLVSFRLIQAELDIQNFYHYSPGTTTSLTKKPCAHVVSYEMQNLTAKQLLANGTLEFLKQGQQHFQMSPFYEFQKAGVVDFRRKCMRFKMEIY